MRASFFDLDGTLIEKQKFLMTNFSRHLASKNIFPKKDYSEMENVTSSYFRKKISYRKIAVELPRIYSTALKGVKIGDIEREGETFAEEVINGYFYPFAIDLTKLMKNYGLTIGISGAPKEVVRPLGKYLNFDSSYGTELEVMNGICTGRIKQNLILREIKEAILATIIKEIDLDESYGFGDTEQDISILSKVGNPVAINPNQKLLSIAQKNSWMIFHLNDDIISEVNKKLNR